MNESALPRSDLDRQWYVRGDGETILGPFSGHVITDMAREGKVGPESLVAPSGSRDWRPLIHAGILPSHPPSALAERPRYAGFWIRVGAYLIDSLIINVGVFVLSFGIFFLIGMGMVAKTGSADALTGWITRNDVYLNLMGFVVWFAYETLFVGGRWQATPGKRICGIYIVRDTGTRIGYGRAFGRYLCYIVDTLILLIGFMMAGWTEEKTALHDLICGTRVVFGRPQPDAQRIAGSF